MTKTLKTAAMVVFLSTLGISAASASSSAKISTLNSQITNLQRSVSQDESAIEQLERKIWGLDARILEAQKQIRKERDEQRAAYHDIKRTVKKQRFDIEATEKSIELVDKDIEMVQRDSQRSQEYFNSLNALKKQFEEASHNEKLRENQLKVEQLLSEKQKLIETLNAQQAKYRLLEEKLEITRQNMETTTVEDDARFADLMKERETSGERITAMRKQVKDDKASLATLKRRLDQAKTQLAQARQAEARSIATAKAQEQARAPEPEPEPEPEPVANTSQSRSYVFVISGEQDPNIEDSLKLKDWVESYGAEYIQAHWNGFDASDPTRGSTETFKRQFLRKLESIDKDARILLIGHGRGGGAAIEAATEIAFNANRTIDFLAVIDPIGDENLRANIVYNTAVKCNKPNPQDQILNTEYLTCLRESKKRLITSNVKHFYNRWQKDASGPADFYRRIRAIGDNGEDISIPTATGRFVTAESIIEDQKRVFIGDDKNAHKKLLAEEARNLPRLLVKHLR
ncbi:MAG: hypothetical protein R3208_14280 [Ketobacteraceae bacterium]|nr:hypothetical protein [Ketobacteraceae bacterium]